MVISIELEVWPNLRIPKSKWFWPLEVGQSPLGINIQNWSTVLKIGKAVEELGILLWNGVLLHDFLMQDFFYLPSWWLRNLVFSIDTSDWNYTFSCKKIAWIWSHHPHLQWKFKLLAGKFTWDNSKTLLGQQTFCFQKIVDNVQQCFAFTPQANFPTHLNFHLKWLWDWIQTAIFYFNWPPRGTIILYLIPLPPYKKVKFCEKSGENADQKKIWWFVIGMAISSVLAIRLQERKQQR